MQSDGLLILLNDVISTLQNLTSAGVKVFKYVGIYNNQFSANGLQNDFTRKTDIRNVAEVNNWPACFIEPIIDTVDTQSLGTQVISGKLIIHIASMRHDLDKNWQSVYQLRTFVHTALHLLKDSNDRYSSLMRMNEQPDFNHDTLYNWGAVYGFSTIDDTSYIWRNSPSAGTNGLAINITIVNSI
jgi:hypothetical protein